MTTIILDILKDSAVDCLKLIPFLFVTYLLIELLEHKTGEKVNKIVAGSKDFGPIIGSFLGAIPQCGFSAIASEFYTHRVITLGTLIAIYLSTSDEMLPILIAERCDAMLILRILGIKVLIGIICGFVIDLLLRKRQKAHIQGECKIHKHEDPSIVIDALKHTGSVILFIFLVTLGINAVVAIIGTENLSGIILNKPVIGELITALIGLVPNCAGSVVITQLYLNGAIGSGALLSGLLAGAGVGPLMLFKTDTNKKECVIILLILYALGAAFGILWTLLGFVL